MDSGLLIIKYKILIKCNKKISFNSGKTTSRIRNKFIIKMFKVAVK